MLRLASQKDEVRVLQLLTEFHNAANLPYGPPKLEKISALFKVCVDPKVPTSVLIVWEEDNEIQGVIAGQLTEVVFSLDRVATELVWWVEPEYRKGKAGASLIEAFEYWAEWNGCKFVQMYGLQNEYSKVLDRYYKQKSFSVAETSYVKEL